MFVCASVEVVVGFRTKIEITSCRYWSKCQEDRHKTRARKDGYFRFISRRKRIHSHSNCKQQLTSEISFGVMASEKTQCTPGKREPSSSHKFRAMHSFRSISSGFDPGALDVRVRTTNTAVVAGTFVLRAIRLRRSQHGGAALGWPRIMIRVAAAATTLWEAAANILVSQFFLHVSCSESLRYRTLVWRFYFIIQWKTP